MITRFTYILKKMCHGSHKLSRHSTFSAHAMHSFNVLVLRYKTAGIHLQGDSTPSLLTAGSSIRSVTPDCSFFLLSEVICPSEPDFWWYLDIDDLQRTIHVYSYVDCRIITEQELDFIALFSFGV